ncbi:MAG: sodium:solute symporter family protein [Calditrichaeota bacterium]|nr:MAG: sodium:solute symporter family protein [Calditrichota bacterium]
MKDEGIIIVLYLLLLFYLGWQARKKNTARKESFLLDNRRLTLPAMVATLVTTWYGGILGVGEFAVQKGVVTWFVFGLPYYIFAVIFALFITPRLHAARYYSIPDILYRHYGKKSGLLGSLLVFVLTSPAPYVLGTAIILSRVFDWSFWLSVILGALFSVAYVYQGGFRSVVQTDKLQFVLMFGGFGLLLAALWHTYGPVTDLPDKLDPVMMAPTGDLSWQEIVVWFLIASWTFVDPSFHQRVAAAQDSSTARNGILWSILFWFVFDMLTLSTALYGAVYLPGVVPLMIYPILAEQVLPALLIGLIYTSLLSVTMSTVDSYSFLAAQTFGRDLLAELGGKNTDMEVRYYTQWGLIISMILALTLIMVMPSVVEMWYTLGTLFIPPLLGPVLMAIFPRYTLPGERVFQLMWISLSVTVGWFFMGVLFNTPWLGVEPFFPGLIVSFIVWWSLRLKLKQA